MFGSHVVKIVFHVWYITWRYKYPPGFFSDIFAFVCVGLFWFADVYMYRGKSSDQSYKIININFCSVNRLLQPIMFETIIFYKICCADSTVHLSRLPDAKYIECFEMKSHWIKLNPFVEWASNWMACMPCIDYKRFNFKKRDFKFFFNRLAIRAVQCPCKFNMFFSHQSIFLVS